MYLCIEICFSNMRKIFNTKITKQRYLQGFFAIVIFLAVIRCVFPGVAKPSDGNGTEIVSGVVLTREKPEYRCQKESALAFSMPTALR